MWRTRDPAADARAELPGTAPLGTAPFGTAPFGTAPLGTAPLDTALIGAAPLGTVLPTDADPGDCPPVPNAGTGPPYRRCPPCRGSTIADRRRTSGSSHRRYRPGQFFGDG